MISPITLLIIGIAAAWIIFILIKDRQFVRSIGPTQEATQEEAKRIATWAELALRPLRNATIASQVFVRNAYAFNAPAGGFSLSLLVIFTAAAAICAFSMFTEFNFLAYSISTFLDEVTSSAMSISGLPLSALLAVALILLVAFAGMVYFDQLGAKVEEEPDLNGKRLFNYRITKFAFHGILLIAIVQAVVGFGRGDEFLAVANYQALINGDAPASADSTNGWAMSLINMIIGFAVPWISAFGARYLLTLLVWLTASCLAVVLFAFLWLPTWILNGSAVRYQNTHGLPPVVGAADRQPGQEQPPEVANPETSPAPDRDEATDDTNDAMNERIEEERNELFERREAERRERERVNVNPFRR